MDKIGWVIIFHDQGHKLDNIKEKTITNPSEHCQITWIQFCIRRDEFVMKQVLN